MRFLKPKLVHISKLLTFNDDKIITIIANDLQIRYF